MGEVIGLPDVYVFTGDGPCIPAFDQELEDAITEVGRDAAFAVARSNGWKSGDMPPKYVWWQIVEQLRAAKS